MKLYSLKSANILKVGYDEMNRILYIEFRLKAVHHYFDVPLDEFVAFMKANDPEEYYMIYVQSKYHFDVFN